MKAGSTQRDSHKLINGAIDTWKATMDGGRLWESESVWVYERECVSECVSERDLREEIRQM